MIDIYQPFFQLMLDSKKIQSREITAVYTLDHGLMRTVVVFQSGCIKEASGDNAARNDFTCPSLMNQTSCDVQSKCKSILMHYKIDSESIPGSTGAGITLNRLLENILAFQTNSTHSEGRYKYGDIA